MPLILSEQADVDKGISVVHHTLDAMEKVSDELSNRPYFEEVNPPPIASTRTEELSFSDSEDELMSSQSGSVYIMGDGKDDEELAPVGETPPSRGDITSNGKVPMASFAAIPVYTKGNFEEVYAASIQRPLMMVENQFSQLQ